MFRDLAGRKHADESREIMGIPRSFTAVNPSLKI